MGSETGLLELGHRYYIPILGRFLNQDPTGQKDDLNLYAYCKNNPLVGTDPSGEGGSDGDGSFDLSNDSWTVVGNEFNSATPSDWWGWAKNNDVTKAFAFIGTVASYIPIPDDLLSDARYGKLGVQAAKGIDDEWALISGMFRDAIKGKGDYGLGQATEKLANEFGSAWVGANSRVVSDSKTMLSEDGLRQYRPPSFKPRIGRYQANIESKPAGTRRWQSNGHLDIVN